MVCRWAWWGLLGALLLPLAAGAAERTPSLAELSWLAGTWIQQGGDEGQVVEETWSAPAGNNMLGTSRTVTNGKVVFFEFMAIEMREGRIVYRAWPAGEGPVEFPVVAPLAGKQMVVFENPVHDFPQRILYQRQGDLLLATVSGKEAGKKRQEAWRYHREDPMTHTTDAFSFKPAPTEMAGRVLRKEALVKAPAEAIYQAWTSEAGVTNWFVPQARVDPRPGGRFEMIFLAEAPAGQQGSEGCRFVWLAPGQGLAFTWNFPPSLPSIRGENTVVVIELNAEPGGQATLVRLSQWGFKDGPDWDQGYAYFDRAWGLVLANLAERFEKGPKDWQAGP